MLTYFTFVYKKPSRMPTVNEIASKLIFTDYTTDVYDVQYLCTYCMLQFDVLIF